MGLELSFIYLSLRINKQLLVEYDLLLCFRESVTPII